MTEPESDATLVCNPVKSGANKALMQSRSDKNRRISAMKSALFLKSLAFIIQTTQKPNEITLLKPQILYSINIVNKTKNYSYSLCKQHVYGKGMLWKIPN